MTEPQIIAGLIDVLLVSIVVIACKEFWKTGGKR